MILSTKDHWVLTEAFHLHVNVCTFYHLFISYVFFQGSERLLLLASDSPSLWSSLATKGDTTKTAAHSPLVRHLGSCVHH